MESPRGSAEHAGAERYRAMSNHSTNGLHASQAAPTAQDRDRRLFSALQARFDALGDEIANHKAQAEHHWWLCCWHTAQADDLAESQFDLVVRHGARGGAPDQGPGHWPRGARLRPNGRAAA
jgi:hypothetical protein